MLAVWSRHRCLFFKMNPQDQQSVPVLCRSNMEHYLKSKRPMSQYFLHPHREALIALQKFGVNFTWSKSRVSDGMVILSLVLPVLHYVGTLSRANLWLGVRLYSFDILTFAVTVSICQHNLRLVHGEPVCMLGVDHRDSDSDQLYRL